MLISQQNVVGLLRHETFYAFDGKTEYKKEGLNHKSDTFQKH